MQESKQVNPESLFQSYRNFVESQVDGIDVGCAELVSVGSKNIQSFRMTLSQISKGRIFKTRKDANGNLWVKRVA